VKARGGFFLDERWLLCDELLEGTEITEMEESQRKRRLRATEGTETEVTEAREEHNARSELLEKRRRLNVYVPVRPRFCGRHGGRSRIDFASHAVHQARHVEVDDQSPDSSKAM
jgi:hypothetical protein